MSRRGWTAGWIGVAWVALLAGGCATTPPAGGVSSPLPGRTQAPAATAEPPAATPAPSPSPAPVSPLPGTPVGTTASGGQIVTTSPAPAVLDTLPSADARAVLETIPEPLPPGERIPARLPSRPSASASTPVATAADSATADTTAAAGEEESDGEVPVPAPTRPLGDRPRPAVSDTTTSPSATPAPATPAPSPAPGASPPPSTSASRDTCWRVQVAAVPEAERAQALRSAAESQLLVPWTIEKEGSLHKVRTRDCLSGEIADRLRKRALNAGFAGAFRFQSKAR